MGHDGGGFPQHLIAIHQHRRLLVGIEGRIIRCPQPARHHVDFQQFRLDAEMLDERQHPPRSLRLEPVDFHVTLSAFEGCAGKDV